MCQIIISMVMLIILFSESVHHSCVLQWDGGGQLNNNTSTSEIQYFHTSHESVNYANIVNGNMSTKWCSFSK